MISNIFLTNHYRVLKYLFDNRTLYKNTKIVQTSYKEISEKLNLSKMTVQNIIHDLLKYEYISLYNTKGKYIVNYKSKRLITHLDFIFNH